MMIRTVFPPIATAIASASRTLPLSVYCPFGRVSSLLQIPARDSAEIGVISKGGRMAQD